MNASSRAGIVKHLEARIEELQSSDRVVARALAEMLWALRVGPADLSNLPVNPTDAAVDGADPDSIASG